MSGTVKPKGNTGITAAPDSPRIEYTIGGMSATFTYTGDYKALEAEPLRAAVRKSVAGQQLFLQSGQVQRKGGSLGVMTLVYGAQWAASQGAGSVLEEVDWEVEWTQVEKPIDSHPRYLKGKGAKGLKPSGGLNTYVTVDGEQVTLFELVANFLAEPKFTERVKILKQIGKDNTLAHELIKKKRHGIESYLEFGPTVKKISTYRGMPGVGECGIVTKAIANVAPPGYEWLKTADRFHRKGTRGKWERVEEWTGAETWDKDLYSR